MYLAGDYTLAMTNLGHIDARMLSDKGQAHPHNEDFVQWREPVDRRDEQINGWLYTIADGVGGADAGEVASQYASERLLFHFLEQASEPDWQERIRTAFQDANQDLRAFAQQMSTPHRMATTMVTVSIRDGDALFTNVGDSRGYHWRRGKLTQVTRDHSLVAKLLEEGVLTPEQAANYPRSNIIIYSLGSDHDPQIDQFPVSLEPGDVLMLCSDGLTRHVSHDELALSLGKAPAEQVASELIALANARGGKDNISAGVIRYWPIELGVPSIKRGSRSTSTFLWFFTLALSILQGAGIVIIWLKLFT